MGYYMRYVTIENREITLDVLRDALKSVNSAYALLESEFDSSTGELLFGDVLCGIVEINRRGDDIFEDDVAELTELITDSDNANEARIRQVLEAAQAMIAVEATWEGRDSEPTLEKIDVLWYWLFAHYDGLLQADNEGFYDQHGVILELDLKI